MGLQSLTSLRIAKSGKYTILSRTGQSIDTYNASIFEEEALITPGETIFENHAMWQLWQGGSMLYIDALCNGIDDLPSVDKEIRNAAC